MSRSFRIAYFAHSLRSDWNNGNAHFLRGLLDNLRQLGHEITVFEPADDWSIVNLREEPLGAASLRQFAEVYPKLPIALYDAARVGDRHLWRERLRDMEIVVLHEWNPPALAHALLDVRDELGFKLLFHDTHHRASSSPEAIRSFGTDRFNGVLAFGEALRSIYRERFGIAKVWTLHEAADTRVFRPLLPGKPIHREDAALNEAPGVSDPGKQQVLFGNDRQKDNSKDVDSNPDVVWIGNWGDDERSSEIREYLLQPASQLPACHFVIYGVRYPEDGLRALRDAGVAYRGYLPNLDAPGIYAHSRLTVHVPRQQYSGAMPGIPTIRVFEALACGIPLLSAPWQDTEHLFRPGDLQFVHSGDEMHTAMLHLLENPKAAAEQAQRGLETVLARHTCRHRAEQVTSVFEEMFR